MAQTGVQYQGMPSAADPPAISGTTVQPQPQQPVQVLQPLQRPKGEQRKKYKQILFGFGVTEVILGSICLLFGTVAIIIAVQHPVYQQTGYYSYYQYRLDHSFTYMGQGIWCGVFLIITGVLGIKAKGSPSVAMYNANMALSILTAILMVPLMTLSGIAAAIESYNASRRPQLSSVAALNSIVVVAGFVGGIVCIVHSAYCCAGVCCRNRRYGHTVAFTAPAYVQPQIVMLPNGQYVPVQMQPYSTQGYQIANVPVAGGQVVNHPPQGQTVVPPVVTQPHGQTAAPVAWPQGQSVPPPYSRVPAMHSQSAQAVSLQPMAYPHQGVPQQVPTVPTGPTAGPTVPLPSGSYLAPPN